MEEREYRYDAFISYRHLPTDMWVAKRLEQLLERHRKKDGEMCVPIKKTLTGVRETV